MRCPACGTAMTEVATGSIKVQACRGGCGGLWFDEWSLRKLEAQGPSAGAELLKVPQNSAVHVDPNQRRKCPVDQDIVMTRHFWSVKREVTVDQCPKCEGVFLDPGELAEIEGQYNSDEQRHQAAHAYYREMFDTQLAGMLMQDKPREESARHVAHVFKFN